MKRRDRAAIEATIAATAAGASATIESAARDIAEILDDRFARVDALAAATKAAVEAADGTLDEADAARAAAEFVADDAATWAAVEEVRRGTGQAVLEALVASSPGVRVADAMKGAQAAVDELDKVVAALLAPDAAESTR